jgi:mannitol/fructose-specific phosphotransferase system IIA component
MINSFRTDTNYKDKTKKIKELWKCLRISGYVKSKYVKNVLFKFCN